MSTFVQYKEKTPVNLDKITHFTMIDSGPKETPHHIAFYDGASRVVVWSFPDKRERDLVHDDLSHRYCEYLNAVSPAEMKAMTQDT